MNKPAPKEPSMDEILSSIRQIIADDDASAVRKPAAPPVSPAPAAPRSFAPPPPRPSEPPPAAPADPEPLALSAEQILRDTADEDATGPGISFSELIGAPPASALVDPDDVTFDIEEDEPPAPEPVLVTPAPAAAPSAYERPRAAPVSQAAPLPDPRLSSDMAEQLLEPAAQSVVQGAFARLSNLSTVNSNVTIEQMMRDMLRPMLKEWLDENLPAVVERMVEQEIARVSRGGR
jgi:cell pole-organizing protein PopZ